MGKHFAQKFSKLLFRPEGNCAIIHSVAFSFLLFFAPCIVQENGSGRPHFFSERWKSVGRAKRFKPAERECTEAKRRVDSAKPNPQGAQASAREPHRSETSYGFDKGGF
jgi:hypothetical protein